MSTAQDHVQDWLVLVSGGWTPPTEGAAPPVEQVVGAWPVTATGSVDRFEPNPLHRPTTEADPTSLVAAAVLVAASGRADGDLVLLAVRDSTVHLAVDHADRPVVDIAPDGERCVVVATSETDRLRLGPGEWLTVDLPALLDLIPPGVDVLVDPGSPTSMRLLTAALQDMAQHREEPW